MTPPDSVALRASGRRAEDDATFRARRRERRLRQELLVRAAVSLLILIFNEVVEVEAATTAIIRRVAVLGLLLNGPYYVAARTGRWLRAQAYVRMLADVLFVTVGLYGAGGLGAAQYLAVYMIIPVYTGIVFSSAACLIATGAATVGYIVLVLAQQAGWAAMTRAPIPNALTVAAFNLLMLDVVGVLSAVLAEAYRRSRRRLAALYGELERAHDESLRLNAQIQKAARLYALGEVAAGITHEIGNVLQTAFAHLSLARRKVAEPSGDVARHLEQVEHGCASAMRIVKHVLETARQPSVEKVPVSLPEVARRVVELKRYDLRRDGIVIELDFPADFPPVLGAPFQLQQLLLNLVANAQDALRARPDRRVITIAGVPAPSRVVVEVADTGPGIPPAALPRVFEPFYTTKDGGTGLGLTISAAIVKGLGGELTAMNRPEGGAVFRVSLPGST